MSAPRSEPMTCAEAQGLMAEQLSESAAESPRQRNQVREHRTLCARCQREWSELQRVQEVWEGLPGPSNAELAEAGLALRRALETGNGPRVSPWSVVGRLARSAALFFLCLLPAWLWWDQAEAEEDPVQLVAAHVMDELRRAQEQVGPWLPEFSLTQWLADVPVRSDAVFDLLPDLSFEDPEGVPR